MSGGLGFDSLFSSGSFARSGHASGLTIVTAVATLAGRLGPVSWRPTTVR